VVRTRVGYAGGTKKNPTYHDLGDHTETMQLEFDPAVISYEKLMELFWQTPNACQQAGSRQYMSVVFYHSEAQRKQALAARDRAAARLGKKVETPVLPLTAFYVAEDYHQKYYLQQRPEVYREVRAMYPRQEDFLRSTLAARLNGILSGHGNREVLEKELPRYGLSAEAAKVVRGQLREGH
jgi:peptide-methionine (S)-S-oxide reductase